MNKFEGSDFLNSLFWYRVKAFWWAGNLELNHTLNFGCEKILI
jgi:hypothetical protein